MKLGGVFRFELGYQARRPWPWLIMAVMLVLSFLVARDNAPADALYTDYFANSPFAVAMTTVFGSLLWLMVAAIIAGEAGARDVATAMHPLVYTTTISKTEYLAGRFLAALAINLVLLLVVQGAILLAIYLPGVDPRVIGPFRPAAFLTAYVFIAVPNAFAATTIQFAAAVRTGRPMTSYLGSFLLFFLAFFVAGLLLWNRGLGILLDPIGVRFIWDELSHLWTTVEKSTRLLALEGTLLGNRLLWLSIGAATLAITYVSFQFAHRTVSSWWPVRRRPSARAPEPTRLGVETSRPISVPHARRTFGLAIQARKTLALGWDSFRTIAKSWAGLGMLVGVPLLTVAVVADQMVSLGTPLTPTTARVIAELTGPLSNEMSRWVIVPVLIIYFAGELVWREREAGLDEITDALPGSAWAPVLGKLVGLGLMLVAFTTLQMMAGMVAQVIWDYHKFELGLYLKILFGLQLSEYLLFAVLALAIHVIVNQKYVGHLVAIVVYVFIAALASTVGIEHNLLVYGASPGWFYTEMRGFGLTIGPWAWFKLYWAAWALLLAVAARLLWVRGKEHSLTMRLREARTRLTGATAATAAIAVALVVSLGGFIFYNTNVLNRYRSGSDIAEARAEYERRHGRYENVPHPELIRADLRIEIYPERRSVEIRGSYRLVNVSGVPIDSIHVATSTSGAETRTVTFDRAATLAVDDAEYGHRIYDLARPLQPGDTLRLDFDVHVRRRGFGNGGADPSVQENGSFFNNGAWFPSVGFQRVRTLLGPAERREHGLPERPLLASLYDEEGRDVGARGRGIMFEAVVGTAEDQVAVAPGALRRTWAEGGRRYFHYATDAPIGNEWAFASARYAVHQGRWNDVAIRIFHHPEHTAHVDRMMRSARASLDYYSRQFGPYPYRHLTIVERPGAPGTGAHADASMISHGEGFAYWSPENEESSFDFPYAIMGHEMAHQWTLPYALIEGLPFLSEGLAWYFGLQMVKESRGDAQLRRLLAFMRQPYPHAPIRRGEPLLRALDPYQAYRKGPLSMYALSQYLGEDRVNGALRRLFARHDSPGAPRATTMHLYRELQAVTPDSLEPLLHDLFEVNTFWHLEAERVSAKQMADSSWQVTLDVRARKMVYDSAGVETEVPVTEWVEIGVFGEGEPGDELSNPLYLEKHRMRSGSQTITVTVSGKPVLAGIDPRHLLDWEEREDDDNIEGVQIDVPR